LRVCVYLCVDYSPLITPLITPLHSPSRQKINPRRECWFLLDCRWLSDWADYVENKEDAEKPGEEEGGEGVCELLDDVI
jgi:hypothetical protein